MSSTSVESEKNISSCIVLPKDYNPVAALQAVEALHSFTWSTCLHVPDCASSSSQPSHQQAQMQLCKQIVAARRAIEMQVLSVIHFIIIFCCIGFAVLKCFKFIVKRSRFYLEFHIDMLCMSLDAVHLMGEEASLVYVRALLKLVLLITVNLSPIMSKCFRLHPQYIIGS